MQSRTTLFIVVMGVIIFYACSIKPTSNIKKAEWLIGTWESKTPEGSIYETWNKENDNEYSGRTYMVKEKDTIVFETIRLVQNQDELFYIPTVIDQNNGLPVRFTSTKITDTEFVFENPKHNFPQMISYSKISSDSLVAEISGTKNGQKNKQTFPMKRTNIVYGR